MGLIRDLDGFVQFVENETTAKRIDEELREKIINAVDIIQNAIEEMHY